MPLAGATPGPGPASESHGPPVKVSVGDHPPTDRSHAERSLRGLVGGGSSQVSLTAAMRARDAARPTEADLVAADTDVVVVRRQWTPRN